MIPLKDDAQMKAYLLEAGRRTTLAEGAGGRFCTSQGAENMDRLLGDRTFLCFHYFLDERGVLTACKDRSLHPPRAIQPYVYQNPEFLLKRTQFSNPKP